jgi:hypothetical protein
VPRRNWVEGTERPPISRSPRGRRLLRPPSLNAPKFRTSEREEDARRGTVGFLCSPPLFLLLDSLPSSVVGPDLSGVP